MADLKRVKTIPPKSAAANHAVELPLPQFHTPEPEGLNPRQRHQSRHQVRGGVEVPPGFITRRLNIVHASLEEIQVQVAQPARRAAAQNGREIGIEVGFVVLGGLLVVDPGPEDKGLEVLARVGQGRPRGCRAVGGVVRPRGEDGEVAVARDDVDLELAEGRVCLVQGDGEFPEEAGGGEVGGGFGLVGDGSPVQGRGEEAREDIRTGLARGEGVVGGVEPVERVVSLCDHLVVDEEACYVAHPGNGRGEGLDE